MRILLIEVSVRWPTESPRHDKSAFISPDDSRHIARLAQIFVTHMPPRAGCLVSTAELTRRLGGEREVVVRDWNFPECFTRCSRTWARSHSFTNPVEASHPRYNDYTSTSTSTDTSSCTGHSTCIQSFYTTRTARVPATAARQIASSRLARKRRDVEVVVTVPPHAVHLVIGQIPIEDALHFGEILHLVQQFAKVR